MITKSFSIADVFAEMLMRKGVGGKRRRKQVGEASLVYGACVYGACVHSNTFVVHECCTINKNPTNMGQTALKLSKKSMLLVLHPIKICVKSIRMTSTADDIYSGRRLRVRFCLSSLCLAPLGQNQAWPL
jgi:hypothetical protein